VITTLKTWFGLMTDEGTPATGAARRRRLGAFVLVALLVAGGIAWWLSDGDDEQEFRERIEAVAGVTALGTGANPLEVNYVVVFDAGIGADDLSRALSQVASIMAERSRYANPVVGRVGEVRFALDLSASTYDRTAAVITAITAIHPAKVNGVVMPNIGLDIRLDEEADVLRSARALLDRLADAGVDDLDLFDGHIGVRVTKEDDVDYPSVDIYDLTVSEARTRLATLARAVSSTSGTLNGATVDDDSVDVTMSVARRSDMVSVRRALLHAFGSETLRLTLHSPT
jgi:hypothetical protein